VSFLALLVNGAFVELLLVRRLVDGKQPRRRRAVVGVLVATTVVIGALLYGRVRIADSSFEQGPRIAVVQEDFPLRTDSYDQPELMFARYAALGARAAAEKPDLLVFPETAWNAFQNIGFVEVEHHAVDEVGAYRWSFASKCHASIAALARGDYRPINAQIALWESLFRRVAPQRRELELPTDLPRLPTDRGPAVAVVVGAVSVETFPEATYPKSKRYNSALLYDKDGTQRRQRYDKNHLVPFGEAVPFRYGRLHWLYRRLNELSPFSGLDGTHEYSLTPGDELTVFELSTERGTVRFGTPICYEDVMPYLVRHYVWDGDQKRVDFLVNISNDGWFLHSAELPQHLAICVFRAVENRVGIARAVNTGISGFIDPNGRIYSLVEKEGRAFGEGIIGYSVDHVMIDRRASLYGRFGDVFARACLILSVPLWIGAVFTRWVLALRRRVARLLSKGGV
jgi:apolipoprotein N-acyltransferase